MQLKRRAGRRRGIVQRRFLPVELRIGRRPDGRFDLIGRQSLHIRRGLLRLDLRLQILDFTGELFEKLLDVALELVYGNGEPVDVLIGGIAFVALGAGFLLYQLYGRKKTAKSSALRTPRPVTPKPKTAAAPMADWD